MIKEHEAVTSQAIAVLGVAYAMYPPLMMFSVIIGSILFAMMTIRGKDYSLKKVMVYIISCGVLSAPLFLPMVDAFYDGGLSDGALGSVTIIVTVVTVRFAPMTFSVFEDVLPNLIPKIIAKITGVKHD